MAESGRLKLFPLLAVLFIWKNASSFVPPHEELDPDAGIVAGRGAAEGFLSVLRRAVPPANLMSVCFTEWRKSFARGRPELAARAVNAEAFLANAAAPDGKPRSPVEDYRAACQFLARRH